METIPPVAKTAMLIRKPVADVFEAFVDPAITPNFWFTKMSGRLEPGQQLRWDWKMCGISAEVSVKEIVQNGRILIEWSGYGTSTTVEWLFTRLAGDATFVSVTNAGFDGNADDVAQQAISSTEGFTLVLARLKVVLEHGIRWNLVADRFPEELPEDTS